MNSPDTYNNCGIILLAAGNSTRMGEPKQLLPLEGTTLLQRSADAALGTGCSPVLVILGANFEAISSTLDGSGLNIVFNENWQEGIGGSIRCGLTTLETMAPGIKSVIIMVADQPGVNSNLLEELVDCWKKTGAPIVASYYQETLGTPALFSRSVFAELKELNGDSGAKKIIQSYGNQVARIEFPEGITDLDTRADYLDFIKQHNG